MANSNRSKIEENWWAFWPKLLEEELAAFAHRGVSYKIVCMEKSFLLLEAVWPIDGDSAPMKLHIGFSTFHPFFRPAVAAPEEAFERHQNPISRELCLLTQEIGQWDSKQLVADFIHERLEQLLNVIAARRAKRFEEAAKNEEQLADPLMPYFAGASEEDSVILFDGHFPVPREGHGLIDLVYQPRSTPKNDQAFEAVLMSLKSSGGRLIGNTFSLPNPSSSVNRITGRWVRLTPSYTTDPEELLKLAEAELTKQAILQQDSVRKVNSTKKSTLSITGIVFEEEVTYGEQKTGSGWLFLATRTPARGTRKGTSKTHLIRGERAGRGDTFSRLPVASSIANKKVFLVGCGAIGSFTGLEMVRAGVGEITFLDGDKVQPGNSLRWPLGRQSWGLNKASALAQFVSQNYPWTKPSACVISIGAAISNPEVLQFDKHTSPGVLSQILTMLSEADIVIDTSASVEVQHALAYHCREMKIPYIMGHATLGVAGGVIARFLPESQGCWVCLQEHWKDGTIPTPLADNSGVVTPVGCNESTFTGGGFDLQEVSLEVARSAVGLLSGGAYDPGAWSIAILRLYDDDGKRVLPHWETFECPPHPRCCGEHL